MSLDNSFSHNLALTVEVSFFRALLGNLNNLLQNNFDLVRCKPLG